MIWTIILAIVLGIYISIRSKAPVKRDGEVGTCPVCGSDKIHIHKRGYSIGLGLVLALILTVFYFAVSIFTTARSGIYLTLDEDGQFVRSATMLFGGIVPIVLGLLLGFAGSGSLRGKCLSCGKDFDM